MPRGARRLDDEVALLLCDAAFRPCRLDQRDEVQQHDGLGRVAQFLQIAQDVFVGNARLLAEPFAFRVSRGACGAFSR